MAKSAEPGASGALGEIPLQATLVPTSAAIDNSFTVVLMFILLECAPLGAVVS
jgi:hypothetical protein